MQTRRTTAAVGSLMLLVLVSGCGGAGQPTAAPPTATSPAATLPAATGTAAPAPTVVATIAPPTSAPTLPPAPAGITGGLLFTRFDESTHTATGMFAMNADGTGERSIPMPWTEGGGRWSTAGHLIAVATQLADGRVGTAILDRAGKVVRTLVIPDPTLNLVCTLWSPDDARLACESWDDTDATRAGIYTVRSTDGGALKRLTTPPAGKADLPGDWGTDAFIVFKRNSGNETEGPLFLVAASGGSAAKALTTSAYEDEGQFSPDGNRIATATGGIVRILDTTGALVTSITEPGAFLFGPSWSPDGKWIVFSSARGGPYADLWISKPDGADRYQVTRTSTNEIAVDWGLTPG